MKMVLQSLRELSYDLSFPIETLPLYRAEGTGIAYTSRMGIYIDNYILENHPNDTKVYVAHEIFHWVIDSSAIHHKYPDLLVGYATDYRINSLLKSLYGYDVDKVGVPGLYREDFKNKTLSDIARRLSAEGTYPNQKACGGIGFPHPVMAECAIYLRRKLKLTDVCSEPFWFTKEMNRAFFEALHNFDTSTINSKYAIDQLVCLRAIWAALFAEQPIHTATVGAKLSKSEIFVYSIPYDQLRQKTIGDSIYSLWVAAKLLNSLDQDTNWLFLSVKKAERRISRLKDILHEPITNKRRKEEELKLAKAKILLQRWKNMPPLAKLFEQPTSVLAASKDLTRMNCLRHKEIPADESWLPSIRANELTKRIGRHTTDILRNLEAANELFADLTKALGESVDSYAKSEADAAAAAEVENPKSEKGKGNEQNNERREQQQSRTDDYGAENGDTQSLPEVQHKPVAQESTASRLQSKQQVNKKEIEKINARNKKGDDDNYQENSVSKAGNAVRQKTANNAKYAAYNMGVNATDVLSKIFSAFVEVDTLLQQVKAKTKKIDSGHDSIYEYGNDASRAVSSELALLENEHTKILFLSKLAQHELLMHAPQKRARTSVILAIDSSGSMSGNNYAMAIGYLLAVTKWMHKEKRGIGVVMFSSVIDSSYFVAPSESLSLNKILAMALNPSFGGTSFDNVLTYALNKANELGWKKANIQIVTDGGDEVQNPVALNDIKTKDQKIIGMVTTKSTQGLALVCDELYNVRGDDMHLRLVKTSGTLFNY